MQCNLYRGRAFVAPPAPAAPTLRGKAREGTHGVRTNGVTAILFFLTEGLFGYSR